MENMNKLKDMESLEKRLENIGCSASTGVHLSPGGNLFKTCFNFISFSAI